MKTLLHAVCYCASFLISIQAMATNTFTLIVENEVAASGAEVCVAITTKNFTDIASIQYVVDWDGDLLQYNDVVNIHPTFNGAVFFNEITPGELITLWSSSTGFPESIPDGETLFELCFTALGASGNVPISLSTAYTIEFTNGLNEIPWAFINGEVNIGGVNSSDLELTDACSNSATCLANDGSVDISPAGGQSPYTYAWTGPGGFTSTLEDITNLSLGLYHLTITDAAGDELAAVVSVGAEVIFSVNAAVVHSTCAMNNGSIEVTSVNGGVPPYAYSWSNGETTSFIDNLASQMYTLTITDDNGCSSTESFSINSTGFSSTVDAVVVNPDCIGNLGSIDLTVTGNAGPYSYLWSTGEITEDISNLLGNTYHVTVTDIDGCTEDYSYLLTDGTVSLDYAYDCDPFTGLAQIGVINWLGGNELFTFEWSNGEVTTDSVYSMIYDLPMGSYSVTVTGQDSGCSSTLTGMDVDCTVTQSPNNCFSQQAMSASGASGSQVCMDIRTNGFTDIKGFQYTLAWDPTVLAYSHIQNYNLPELEESDFGDAQVGNGLLSVLWLAFNTDGESVADGTSLYQVCFDLIGADGTSSDVYFTDSPTPYGVITSDDVEIGFNAMYGSIEVGGSTNTLMVTDICTTAPGCINTSTGDVQIEVSGGTAPYTYVWINAAGTVIATTEDLNGIAEEGWYQVDVTDSNGATAVAYATLLINAPEIYGNYVSNVLCNGDASGSIQIQVQEGTMPYTYTWSNGATTQDVLNLVAGTYSVTVQDQEGCTISQDFTVNEPAAISAVLAEHICPSASGDDGGLDITVSGGTGLYSYSWSNGSTTQDIGGLTEGDYGLTVTDQLGCTEMTSFYLGDCVWPGDTDTNGVVNNFDLLNIGLAYGTNGTTRPNASIAWFSQNADNWPESTPNSNVNYKHIDTNGEGLVDDNDTLAVAQNWGEMHNFTGGSTSGLIVLPPSGSVVTSPFYVQPDSFEANEVVSLPIILGDVDNPIDELYGLAFSITYDPEIVVPGTAYLSFDNSWIGTVNTDMLTIQRTFHSNGRIDVAMVRTDGMNMAGQGEIASLFITIEDDLVMPPPGFDGVVESLTTDIGIENVLIITNIEEEVQVAPMTTTSTIESTTTGLNEAGENFDLHLYPNPVVDQLHIKSTARIESVKLYDATAKLLGNYEYDQAREAVLKTNDLAEGTYVVKIQTEEGLAVRRIVVLK